MRETLKDVLLPLPSPRLRQAVIETAVWMLVLLATAAPFLTWQWQRGFLGLSAVTALIAAWTVLVVILRPLRLAGADNATGLAVLGWIGWAVVCADIARGFGWSHHDH